MQGVPAVVHPVREWKYKYRDNAQIELVDHGLNGWVTPHSSTSMASATLNLIQSPEAYAAFSKAAIVKARIYSAGATAESLRHHLRHLAKYSNTESSNRPRRLTLANGIVPSPEELKAYAGEYSLRKANTWKSPAEPFWNNARSRLGDAFALASFHLQRLGRKVFK